MVVTRLEVMKGEDSVLTVEGRGTDIGLYVWFLLLPD